MSSITFPINIALDEGLPGTGKPDGPPPFNVPDMLEAPLQSVTSAILFIVYASLIITSNMVMLVAYVIEKRLRTYNNSFIINLILTDLTVGFSLIVLFVSNCHPGVFWCKIFLGINDGVLSVSVITIVVICVDRYQATYQPIKHFTSRSKTKAYLLNAIPWVVAFIFWLPFAFFGFDASTPTDGDRLIRILLLSLPVMMTILPLFIITVLYARILYKIRNSLGAQHLKDKFDMKSSSCEEGPNTGTSSNGGSNLAPHHQSQDDSKIAMKSADVQQTGQNKKSKRNREYRDSDASARKATRSLSFIIISFLVSWMPHVIFVIVTSSDQSILLERKLPDVMLAFISTIRFTNSFLNPVSYAVAQPLFRGTVAGMICNPKQYC
eukprot:XP_011666649.1 PREDICTED: beta-1 adrenergic receptor-like [Strongylocentrotus purpuratus]